MTILAFFDTTLGKWLLIALAVIAALFAGAVYEREQQREKDVAEFAKERAAQAKVNQDAIAALDAKYRKAEQDHQAAVTQIGVDYAQKLADATDQRNKDVAAARAGALKLRIPPGNPNDSSAPKTGGSSGGGNGAEGGELPQQVTSDLYALADDADQVAKQLSACQAVITADRLP